MKLATTEAYEGWTNMNIAGPQVGLSIVAQTIPVRSTIVLTSEMPPQAVSCSSCYLRNMCLPSGLTADKLPEMDELTQVKRKLARGATLYRTGDIFDSLYAVRSGSFKSIGISRVGQGKVTGQHLPGEMMALDAISRRIHGYDAVALEDSEVCVVPYTRLTSACNAPAAATGTTSAYAEWRHRARSGIDAAARRNGCRAARRCVPTQSFEALSATGVCSQSLQPAHDARRDWKLSWCGARDG